MSFSTERPAKVCQSKSARDHVMSGPSNFRAKNPRSNSRGESSARKLACVLALFAALFSLVSPTLCAPRDCMPLASPRPLSDCQGMPTGGEKSKPAPSSPMHCCDLSQSPQPAAQTPIFVAPDAHLVAIAVLGVIAPMGNAVENFAVEARAVSRPADLQSLFCTLLI